MKIYKVKVNNKVYEVELESVTEKSGEIIQEKPLPKVEKQEQKVELARGTELKAPMQGTILDIKVKIGDSVNKGQCVVILESMKLENEIVAPATGVIKQILVSKGQNVANQQTLIIIE